MTGPNKQENAKQDLERAETCLAEAQVLHDKGFPYGAASRAYYAVFHAARSLLFSRGFEVRSHRALGSLIGEHFIRPGILQPRWGRLLSRMQRDREDADYETGAVFTEEEAATMIADATAFIEHIKQYV